MGAGMTVLVMGPGEDGCWHSHYWRFQIRFLYLLIGSNCISIPQALPALNPFCGMLEDRHHGRGTPPFKLDLLSRVSDGL